MQFIDLKTQYQRIKHAIDKNIQDVIDSGNFIMGPEIKLLETQLAEFTGAKHAITCANGTDALQLALMAIDIKPGDEIITTPFTFIATCETIALLGAVPVMVDIEENTYNIDPSKIEAAITSKTKAIMPVSLYGQPANFTAINEIAAKYQLIVIEDAAQSFGATHHGKRSCNLSTIATTSFFPSKPLGCYGDGGACFTNDDAIALKLSQLRVHGQDRRYHHPLIGVNSRLDTLQAAILIAKLTIFADEIAKRQMVANAYNECLQGKVVTPFIAPENTSVYAQYTIQVENRDNVINTLKEKNIPTAVHYPVPLHLQPAFAYLGLKPGTFPISEAAAKRVMSLPMHPYLEMAEIQEIAQVVG
ncbi:MAG: DegT/DnrJ/EryC1/StrS family aminotransferase [Legionellales bacterium]|nr:DegT/DnrJ/EryC1/StrS family aminotransferase [Legionellales bacterium]